MCTCKPPAFAQRPAEVSGSSRVAARYQGAVDSHSLVEREQGSAELATASDRSRRAVAAHNLGVAAAAPEQGAGTRNPREAAGSRSREAAADAHSCHAEAGSCSPAVDHRPAAVAHSPAVARCHSLAAAHCYNPAVVGHGSGSALAGDTHNGAESRLHAAEGSRRRGAMGTRRWLLAPTNMDNRCPRGAADRRHQVDTQHGERVLCPQWGRPSPEPQTTQRRCGNDIRATPGPHDCRGVEAY
mmetsp:Transcript_36023/g.99309  ORF Transcript_36023/g.99309 Transcript_36023/m.99309 type:complete len:242 (+) Transcript_36023:863-1588(+)